MCSVTTHILPTGSVVKGHHVQDLLLFDKRAVAFDPTWTKGRRPYRTMLRCETDILQCLDWNIQNCLLREDQGGYLKSQCVSVEEPPKTNILNVTSISANVCRRLTPHLCFCLWLEILICFCQQTLSHHNLIWHKKKFHKSLKTFLLQDSSGPVCSTLPQAIHTQS